MADRRPARSRHDLGRGRYPHSYTRRRSRYLRATDPTPEPDPTPSNHTRGCDVSKASRRRQRPGNQPTTNRPTGSPSARPGRSDRRGRRLGRGRRRIPPPPASTASGAGAPGATAADHAPSDRHGRATELDRGPSRPPRAPADGLQAVVHGALPDGDRRRRGAVVGIALVSVFVFLQSSQPAYACSNICTPEPTARRPPVPPRTSATSSPTWATATSHVATRSTYTYCAPASGSHYNVAGAGPIAARVYGPTDSVIPQGWIHNLEHGGLVDPLQDDQRGRHARGPGQVQGLRGGLPAGRSRAAR